MLKALALKELRETAGITVLGLIVYAAIVIRFMGVGIFPWDLSSPYEIPFVSAGFLINYAVAMACLAIALGLRQSAWESVGDTYQFLLHRPMKREHLIAAKLVAGVGLCLACSALPVLLYACWAATPGTNASPFYWSMTEPAWKLWIVATILYLGAFLSGIRPGRWFGTRLVPLVAAGLLAFLAVPIPWWWALGLATVVLIDALLAVTIFYVVRTRDY